MLVNAFKAAIFPYIVEIAVILFVLSIAGACYQLFRDPNWQKFIDRLKCAIIAYSFARSAFLIVDFVNRIVNNIKL